MTLRLTIALVVLLLAVPAAALAQGAGDEQYSDPLAPDAQQQQADPTPTATPAPMATAAPVPTTAPSSAAPAAPAPSTGSQLPYTGLAAGWVALGGGLLLGAGVVLRRRLREER